MKSARISHVPGMCLRSIAVLAPLSMSLSDRKQTARTVSEARRNLPPLSLRFPISQKQVQSEQPILAACAAGDVFIEFFGK
jgi:hypothetical protein